MLYQFFSYINFYVEIKKVPGFIRLDPDSGPAQPDPDLTVKIQPKHPDPHPHLF